MTEVVKQLTVAGLMPEFLSYEQNGTTLLGTVRLEVIDKLKADPRFANGVFYGLHRDVGTDLMDFRSHNGELGNGSLQLVIDRKTGRTYCDVDKFSPYSDLVSIIGHTFGEMLPALFRRRRRQTR